MYLYDTDILLWLLLFQYLLCNIDRGKHINHHFHKYLCQAERPSQVVIYNGCDSRKECAGTDTIHFLNFYTFL